MSGWRREGCRITASPNLNTLFPAVPTSKQPWLTRSMIAVKSRAWQPYSAGRMRATSTPFWQSL